MNNQVNIHIPVNIEFSGNLNVSDQNAALVVAEYLEYLNVKNKEILKFDEWLDISYGDKIVIEK